MFKGRIVILVIIQSLSVTSKEIIAKTFYKNSIPNTYMKQADLFHHVSASNLKKKKHVYVSVVMLQCIYESYKLNMKFRITPRFL